MKVSDLHQHELVTAQAEETLDEAADRMHWHQVGALPVFDGQRLVGIITERDLTAALAEGADAATTPVADYMTLAPAVPRPDSELAHAAHAMLRLGVRHLPVMQGGRLGAVHARRPGGRWAAAARGARFSGGGGRRRRRPRPRCRRRRWSR